jgi:D-arabinose 5-phosphate isomerase GutQ
MNVHVINRADTWSTARPFIAADDLVVWTDTDGIRSLSEELKSAGMKIVCLASDDGSCEKNNDFTVITDQAWVQYVLDSTALCSWG